ncbi:MAG: hypothetical protein Q9166_006862 [cf. Caloplaca sp. 2 TL-2023]
MSARSFVSRRFFSQQTSQSSTRWQQYRPYIPVYATIGICCSGCAYNFYADDQANKKRNFKHRDFIDTNLVFNRENYNAGRWWTTLTYSFMHTMPLHLAVNMFALSSFGPLGVALFGLPATAALWLGGSVSSMYLSMLGEDYKKKQARSGVPPKEISIAGWPLPRGNPVNVENAKHIGSSASLLAILTAVACRLPKHEVFLFPIPVGFPLYGAIGGFAIMSAIAYAQDLIPFFGHAGHLGGMAFGALYYVLALRTKRFPKV